LRVLVVLPFPPLYEGGAAARCAIGLLQGLLASGVQCEALAADARPIPTSPPDGLPVEIVRVPLPSPRRARWESLAHPGRVLASGPFAQRLRERAAGADVVHLVELHAALAVRHLDRPTLVQLHCLTRRDREIRGPWTREDRVTLELARAERKARRRASWMLVNSPEVAAELAGKMARSRLTVAPLALDPSHYGERAPLEHPVAGLIGTARWPPTANAVRRLLARVWPLVLERRPSARLILAGAGMEASAFGALADLPGVEWRGHVASATDFLRELGVLLYPLSAGSGAKVKVLEALALGLPVVTTTEGAEGLAEHGGVAVHDDDARIAQAAVALLDDVHDRRMAGARAHENFLTNHTPKVAAAPVVDLYERMIA
jgi:polysaccharide biosynthesis protein PslH